MEKENLPENPSRDVHDFSGVSASDELQAKNFNQDGPKIETKQKLTSEEARELQKTKIIKIVSTVIAVLLFIGLLNSLWWIYSKFVNPSMFAPEPTPTITPLPSPTPTQKPVFDKSTWVTYENTKIGYNLRHPQEWSLSELDGALINTVKIRPVSRSNGIEISSFLKSGFNEADEGRFRDAVNVSMNNIEMKFVSDNSEGGYSEYYRFENMDGQHVVTASIKAGRDQDYLHLLQEILREFELLDVASESQSQEIEEEAIIGWRRYYSDSLGVRIDVPQDWEVTESESLIEVFHDQFPASAYFSISKYDSSQTDEDAIISSIGSEYAPDRVESRSFVSDWQYPGVFVTVTTPRDLIWYSENVVTWNQDKSKLYLISNNGNRDSDFADFWRSFRLE